MAEQFKSSDFELFEAGDEPARRYDFHPIVLRWIMRLPYAELRTQLSKGYQMGKQLPKLTLELEPLLGANPLGSGESWHRKQCLFWIRRSFKKFRVHCCRRGGVEQTSSLSPF